MKYGWRERIIGAIILVALGAIFLPMLFDDPEPRDQGPEPVMVIEQPVGGGETRQRIIESPQPPASVADSGNMNAGNTGSAGQNGGNVPEPDTRSQLGGGSGDTFGQNGETAPNAGQGADPIAELAQNESSSPSSAPAGGQAAAPPPAEPEPEPAPAPQSQASQNPAPAAAERTPASSGGGWVVQVGSFGQSGNATRLAADLKSQGFAAYSQPRDNNLTTVYVGPFDSSDAGEKARAELKQAANIQGLLIRRPGS